MSGRAYPADWWLRHPWSTIEHDPGKRRSSCHGCSQWCYPDDGCWCCNEPAYEWCLEEARWWAGQQRDGLSDWSHATSLTQGGMPGRIHRTFPWEAPS